MRLSCGWEIMGVSACRRSEPPRRFRVMDREARRISLAEWGRRQLLRGALLPVGANRGSSFPDPRSSSLIPQPSSLLQFGNHPEPGGVSIVGRFVEGRLGGRTGAIIKARGL